MTRRLWFAVAALLLSVAACSGSSGSDVPEGCGDCEAEIGQLKDDMAALEEVESVEFIRYVPERTLTRPPAIDVTFVPASDPEAAASALASTAEASGIAPLKQLHLSWSEGDRSRTTNLVRESATSGPFGQRTYPSGD